MYATKLKEQEVPKRMRQSRQKQASGKVTNEDSFTKEELDIRVQIVKDITDLLSGPKEEQSVSAKIAAIDALDISALNLEEEFQRSSRQHCQLLLKTSNL